MDDVVWGNDECPVCGTARSCIMVCSFKRDNRPLHGWPQQSSYGYSYYQTLTCDTCQKTTVDQHVFCKHAVSGEFWTYNGREYDLVVSSVAFAAALSDPDHERAATFIREAYALEDIRRRDALRERTVELSEVIAAGE